MNVDSLIERLKERLQFSPALEMDKNCGRSNDKGEILPPPKPNRTITHDDVNYVEQQLGFKLPTLVRRLSTEVADGRYGPAWGINRLKHPPNYPFGPFWDIEMSVESWHRLYQEQNDEQGRTWRAAYPAQFIRYCEVGCNISIGIDCSSDAAMLFEDDPNRSDNNAECVVPMNVTLEVWLWKWLNENRWPTKRYP